MIDKFRVDLTDEAQATADHLTRRDRPRAKKLAKAIRLMKQVGPEYPGFQTHVIDSISGPYGKTWQSYIENNTPNAWRILWCYGPTTGVITVFLIRNHLD